MKDIIQTQYCDEMQKSYLDYSMSVITDRAIADIRDGLKPVQRRTIYAMHKLGLSSNKQHRKSARIVGDTMGKYHPHGDSSIYESLVVMQQEFKKKVALVDGHGNFGSVEGDGAAAMRYTEARLQEFTMDVYLKDIDMNMVDFVSNFDDTEKEPVVLPARLPMILINGCEGIAVGMSTSIPPHNLDEIVNAVKLLMDNPKVDDEKLFSTVQGPDFPLKCEIINKDDIREIYSTGYGRLSVRGILHLEKKAGRTLIVIDGLPPSQLGLGMGRFLDDIVALNDKKLTSDISDIRNETDETGIRIVVELKKDADVDFVRKLIENKTRYTDTFPVSMLVIEDGKAKVKSLRGILESHIEFMRDINLRKYAYLLEDYLDKEEILEGLIRAVDIIDLIIEIIRGSKSVEIAKNCLINGEVEEVKFKTEKSKKAAQKLYFTPKQAQAILDMRLSKLIGLEIITLNNDYNSIVEKIEDCRKILKDKKYLDKRIQSELIDLKKKYHQDRVTILSNINKEKIVVEKPVEDLYVTIDDNSYIYIDKNNENSIKVKSNEKLVIFTSSGKQLQVNVVDIPNKKDNPKGIPLENICAFDRNMEKILYSVCRDELTDELIFVTKKGLGKRVVADEFITNAYKSKATKIKADDEIVYVGKIFKDSLLVLSTDSGGYYKLKYDDINLYSKSTQGTKLVRLGKDVSLINAFILNENDGILLDNGKQINLKRFDFMKLYKPR